MNYYQIKVKESQSKKPMGIFSLAFTKYIKEIIFTKVKGLIISYVLKKIRVILWLD